MVYINKGEHDNPHELPKENLEGSLDMVYNDYTHTDTPPKLPEEVEKLEYIYQHFQDREKKYETGPQVTTEQIDDTLYPQINNDIEYGLFENVIDSQIRDDFQCTKACYTHNTTASIVDTNPQCTHTYDHISQQLNSLADAKQQQMLYTNEVDASLFTTDTSTQCAFNITPSNLETKSVEDTNDSPKNNTSIHFYSKHIQYHDFDNVDAFIYKDKYTALLQHELQNPFGVYMIQSQLKAIRYPLTWTLKLCLMLCIFLATLTQSPKLIMCHIKPYSMMIKVCSQLN